MNQQVQEIKVQLKKYLSIEEYIKIIDENESILLQEVQKRHKHFQTELMFIFSITDNSTTWMQYLSNITLLSLRKSIKHFLEFDSKLQNEKERKKVDPLGESIPSLEVLRKHTIPPHESSKVLSNYLQSISNNHRFKHIKLVRNFLETCDIKSIGNRKFKETYVKKRSGGRHKAPNCWKRIVSCCNQWNKRYLIVTSEGVMVAKEEFGNRAKVREMLLFDYNFKLEYGKIKTGYQRGILIRTTTRNLFLQTYDDDNFIDLVVALIEAYKNSSATSLHRFDSFAPIRQHNKAEWFIDGKDFYNSVCDSLLNAKNEIFITDWWLSPQLYLRRPVGKDFNQEYRLDRIIQQKAKEGVKVQAIVYNEPTIALTMNSAFTQQIMNNLHPNIQLLRHPNYILPLLWSHHEKIIVIDQMVAYVGGLDLCYGRMDTQKHELLDLSVMKNDGLEDFPGCDYANSRIKDWKNVEQFELCDIQKNVDPRMPWHDISVKIEGSAVRDVSRHFIQYWNFVCVDLDQKGRYNVLQLQEQNQEPEHDESKKIMTRYKEKVLAWSSKVGSFMKRTFKKRDDKEKQQELSETNQIRESRSQTTKQLQKIDPTPLTKQMSEEPKKKVNSRRTTEMLRLVDSLNPLEQDKKARFEVYLDQLRTKKQTQNNSIIIEESMSESDQNSIDIPLRQATSIIPSEDSSEEEKKVDQDLFVSKTSFIKSRKEQGFDKEDENVLDMLLSLQKQRFSLESENFFALKNETPKSTHKQQTFIESSERGRSESEIQKSEREIFLSYNQNQTQNGTCNIQVLRSSSNWSMGLSLQNTEYSIQIAYIQLITQAEHFIYIENQFFISCLAGFPITNQIAKALLNRIKKAALNQESFYVIVVMPLLPGFEGEIDADNSNVMKIQLHWEYLTISRGGNSLLEQLSRDENIKNPEKYIQFVGLRTHAKTIQKPVTEIVYVHSKLMIVDDRHVICGSANINDRSMKGTRDSEIAVVISDQNMVDSKLGNKDAKVGQFSHTLRKQIFREHFGISEEQELLLEDPCNPQFINLIRQRMILNTEIYREIFCCYPDDTVLELKQLNDFRKKQNLERYEELKDQIKGLAVIFPTQFLRNESLKFPIYSKEYLCPEINFT